MEHQILSRFIKKKKNTFEATNNIVKKIRIKLQLLSTYM